MARFVLLLVLVASSLGSVASASASVPSPTTSTLPDCLVACPGGDMTFTIVVRDFAANPIANSTVTIDLSNCPAFNVCPHCTDGYVYDPVTRTVRKLTNAAGAVSFSICGGGACDIQVPVFADGVFIGSRSLAVTDQNGDFVVDAADVGIANAKVGGAFPSADLDCDGDVDADDVAIVQSHAGHLCVDPTPTRSSSWGTMKTIYR
jgi:hypothetical protein